MPPVAVVSTFIDWPSVSELGLTVSEAVRGPTEGSIRAEDAIAADAEEAGWAPSSAAGEWPPVPERRISVVTTIASAKAVRFEFILVPKIPVAGPGCSNGLSEQSGFNVSSEGSVVSQGVNHPFRGPSRRPLRRPRPRNGESYRAEGAPSNETGREGQDRCARWSSTVRGAPLRWDEGRATPRPGPLQLVLQVRACGVCRTDLHIADGELPDPSLPLVLGHEVVAEVAAVGPNAQRFQVGARVGLPWLGWACGSCPFCRSGRENLCDRAVFTGYHRDGGYAEEVVADERFVFRIPSGFGDVEAAPLLCAG